MTGQATLAAGLYSKNMVMFFATGHLAYLINAIKSQAAYLEIRRLIAVTATTAVAGIIEIQYYIAQLLGPDSSASRGVEKDARETMLLTLAHIEDSRIAAGLVVQWI